MHRCSELLRRAKAGYPLVVDVDPDLQVIYEDDDIIAVNKPLESPQLPCTDTKEVGVKQCCWKQSPEDRFPSWFANQFSFRCRLERLILVMKIGSVFSGTKGNSGKICSTCEFNLQECKVPFPANNTSSSSPGVRLRLMGWSLVTYIWCQDAC